jgi:copper chaperone
MGIYNKKGKSYVENTLNLAIEGMHCGTCVRRVTNALQSVEGVTVNSVEVGSAEVAFEATEIAAQDITAALDRKGFPARVKQ